MVGVCKYKWINFIEMSRYTAAGTPRDVTLVQAAHQRHTFTKRLSRTLTEAISNNRNERTNSIRILSCLIYICDLLPTRHIYYSQTHPLPHRQKTIRNRLARISFRAKRHRNECEVYVRSFITPRYVRAVRDVTMRTLSYV